ncbi:MAG: DUF4430 domain-containing protein [Candidatus Heimdallarchaeota archaeon]|nr:DUF4430 domain-containing protein [Candidatus Heimdallarchaeota archaeon]
MKRSKLLFLILAIILIVSLSLLLSFYIQFQKVNESDKEIEIQVVIHFGSLKIDANPEEYNINVTEGSSALEAFALVVELTLENHSFGAYIVGVNGYLEELPDYWRFYYYDYDQENWVISPVGVSHYYLQEGDKIKLHYSG